MGFFPLLAQTLETGARSLRGPEKNRVLVRNRVGRSVFVRRSSST